MKMTKALVLVLVCNLEAAPVFAMEKVAKKLAKAVKEGIAKIKCKCCCFCCCCKCDAGDDSEVASIVDISSQSASQYRSVNASGVQAEAVSALSREDKQAALCTISNLGALFGDAILEWLCTYRNEANETLMDIAHKRGLEAMKKALPGFTSKYMEELCGRRVRPSDERSF